jgi:hypothetical protein
MSFGGDSGKETGDYVNAVKVAIATLAVALYHLYQKVLSRTRNMSLTLKNSKESMKRSIKEKN